MNSKMKSLFYRQSNQDNWEDYIRSITLSNFPKWDYIILTASNEDQANAFRIQIKNRITKNLLPKEIKYAVLPDPDGKRVGSGGATLNVLKYIKEETKDKDCFKKLKILVIHSGGDSKRVPQYSAIGKLFSPVPHFLPNQNISTLFDEFIIGLSTIPSRIQKGMLVLSGDVLLLFNPLQIDFSNENAACISFKEDVEIGKNHGVFNGDNNHCVKNFYHKLPVEKLKEFGCVNQSNKVNLDTGAIIFNTELLNGLFSLISKDNLNVDNELFNQYVNDNVRINFYADFLFPLCSNATLEEYYKEAPEGKFSLELKECRTKIWNILNNYKMKLISLSPAQFIHFGTTKELRMLMTENLQNYFFLDWKSQTLTNIDNQTEFSCINSIIDENTKIEKGVYIENSLIKKGSVIKKNCVLSNITLENVTIPENVALHSLKLKNGKFVVRIFNVNDNPKELLEKNGSFLGQPIQKLLDKTKLNPCDIWKEEDEHYLWFANLFKETNTVKESLDFALNLYNILNTDNYDIELFKNSEKLSLYSSFNNADSKEIINWDLKLSDKIRTLKFLKSIEKREPYEKATLIFGSGGVKKQQLDELMKIAENSDFSTKIRIYYYLSKISEDGLRENLEQLTFNTLKDSMINSIIDKNKYDINKLKIAKDTVKIDLPVRINFGGGWSDTPPFCLEHGGTVLNVAIKLNGHLPIEVIISKIHEKCIILESKEDNNSIKITDIKSIQKCNSTFDPFCLLKSSLLASELIPLAETKLTLTELLEKIGGGFKLSTNVNNIPRGSGLGTSSILGSACIKAIYEFLGKTLTDEELYNRVLILEQLMSTGGGWQDQIGGLINGMKLISTSKGIKQSYKIEKINFPVNELKERFSLIYTGQRRLARNILREIIGKYIGGNKDVISRINEMQDVSVLMKYALEKGNIEKFAELLNRQWEYSKKLDNESTNTCVEQIFLNIEDLIIGKMVCGAGGGGFLQVVLKKGVSTQQLHERLINVFQDTGVDVWDYEFI